MENYIGPLGHAEDLAMGMIAGVCRVCKCTDYDCRACVEKTGVPCTWVDIDLCSACARIVYIFDLDGTLADIEHRRHLVENGNKEWDAFYEACVDDKPNWPVIGMYQALDNSPFREIWIFSGRSEAVRKQTEDWLEAHEIYLEEPERLVMRPEGDYTPDQELKRRWLDEYNLRNRVVAIFDDRQKVVDMWRAEGLVCFQVAPGGF